MKGNLTLVCMLFIMSCSSKHPLKIDIDNFERGLEITNTVISTENLFENKCIKFDSGVPDIQTKQGHTLLKN